ncbi:hypothetical protein CMI37_12370 [Candidatus Pacearchaeota archaeon]|nr:hypothetical protein [Candidatus Pacearchaeota archaeon]|tara:strand:+ start:119 stop:433 length:315 start_codon:yes stop_codon:yes gene_type:complete
MGKRREERILRGLFVFDVCFYHHNFFKWNFFLVFMKKALSLASLVLAAVLTSGCVNEQPVEPLRPLPDYHPHPIYQSKSKSQGFLVRAEYSEGVLARGGLDDGG